MSRPCACLILVKPICVYILSVSYVYWRIRVYVPSVSMSTEALRAVARYALELAILSMGTKGNAKPRAERM